MGNTKVMCIVTGPSEQQQQQQAQAQRRGGQPSGRDAASINVNVVIAGFSSVDRKKRARNDKLVNEWTRKTKKQTPLDPPDSLSQKKKPRDRGMDMLTAIAVLI